MFRSRNIRHSLPVGPARERTSTCVPLANHGSVLNPQPHCGFLCSLTGGLNGPLLGRICNAQSATDFTTWVTRKTSSTNFCGFSECPPAPASAILQFLVLGSFPDWLPQSAPPMTLWVPAWSGVLKPWRRWSCLAREMLLQCAGGTSAVFPGQHAGTNQRQLLILNKYPMVIRNGHGQMTC